MSKNILIFADGTGNEGGLLPDESRTNVYKLFRATRTGPDSIVDPAKQIAFYFPGIGTAAPRHDSLLSRCGETIQQMMGLGLTKRIIDCYVAIISVWSPGDRIYLFGFSRGAYTVRCVAHVLELFGIPTKEPGTDALSFEPKHLRGIAKKAVRSLYRFGMPVKDDENFASSVSSFQREYGSQMGPAIGATPYFIGVWDTVAAMGWQRVFPQWTYDRHFPHDVKYARHLQSIDETRSDFVRVPWGGHGTVKWPERKNEPEQFDQIWFSGNHADVGGSYPENESRLSDITLKWMVDFVTHEVPQEGRVIADLSLLHLYPSSSGMMHDECMVGIGGSPIHWFAGKRDVPDTATLHPTVFERLKMERVRNFVSYGLYRPAALENHKMASEFFQVVSQPTGSER